MEKIIINFIKKVCSYFNDDELFGLFEFIINEINTRKIQKETSEELTMTECEELKELLLGKQKQKINYYVNKLYRIEFERKSRGIKDYKLTLEQIKDKDFLYWFRGIGNKTIKVVTSNPQLYFDELQKYHNNVLGD